MKPESSSISSSVRPKLHVDEILIIRGSECEREHSWLADRPIVTLELPVVVVLDTESIRPVDVEGVAVHAELGALGDHEVPPAPPASAIGISVGISRGFNSCYISASEIKCFIARQCFDILWEPWWQGNIAGLRGNIGGGWFFCLA